MTVIITRAIGTRLQFEDKVCTSTTFLIMFASALLSLHNDH